jgi:hypothetical protein
LKNKLKKYIKDDEILYIINLIIDSYYTDDKFDDLLKNYDYYLNENEK